MTTAVGMLNSKKAIIFKKERGEFQEVPKHSW